MSSELVERLQITVRQPNESAGDLIDRWRKDRADAVARIEALEAENARKDDALKRVEWALTKQSLTDKERVQDALSVARRAHEGGNDG